MRTTIHENNEKNVYVRDDAWERGDFEWGLSTQSLCNTIKQLS